MGVTEEVEGKKTSTGIIFVTSHQFTVSRYVLSPEEGPFYEVNLFGK